MGDVIDLQPQHNPECDLHNAVLEAIYAHGAPLSIAQVLGVMDLVKNDLMRTVNEGGE